MSLGSISQGTVIFRDFRLIPTLLHYADVNVLSFKVEQF